MKSRDASCELNVLVGGKVITEYQYEGNTFIEGRKGSDFELEYKNQTRKRVLVIPAVDGISVLDGTPATPESKGYLVPAWGSVRIPGWTIDGNHVSKFQFQDKEKSYASRTTESGPVQAGVIGVIVYEEEEAVKPVEHHHHHYHPAPKINPIPTWPGPNAPYPGYPNQPGITWGVPYSGGTLRSSELQTSFNSAIGSASTQSVSSASLEAKGPDVTTSSSESVSNTSFDMGTGWGERLEFKVNQTKFNRGDMTGQLVIYYDSRRNLEKRGIEVVRRETRYLSDLPQAFSGIGCPPPPDWKG
jgi:hypothetical protein